MENALSLMKKGIASALIALMLCTTLIGCEKDEKAQEAGGVALPDSSSEESIDSDEDESSESSESEDEGPIVADWYVEMPSIGTNYIDDVLLTEEQQIDRREGVRIYRIKGTDEETKVLKCVTDEFGEFTKEVEPNSYSQDAPASLVAELKFEDEKAILKEFRILLNDLSADYEKGKKAEDLKDYFEDDAGDDLFRACYDALETREDREGDRTYRHKFNYTALKQSENDKSYLEDEYIVLNFRFDLSYEWVIGGSISSKEVKDRESTIKVIKNKDGKYVISEVLDIELFSRNF